MRPSEKPLITRAEIAERVRAVGAEISRDHTGSSLVLIVVLKGALLFAADLARAITGPVEIDFIRAKSYRGTESGGEVRFTTLPEIPLRGRHVLIVEDILDTGLTATKIREHLAREAPASLNFCTLLDKPGGRKTPVEAKYVCFRIPNEFVVGYGLDIDERYRNLPDIHRIG